MEKVMQILMQVEFINMGCCDDIEDVYEFINNLFVDVVFESI